MSFERFFTPYEADTVLPGRTVAVLAPHPDDEVFGCGGTLQALVADGAAVHVAVVSDGGGFGRGASLVQRRREESCQAAALLGYLAPEFWALPDGQLMAQTDLGERIDAWLDRLKPDLLLVPSVWEMHRDHRAVAEAALACLARRQPQTRCRLAMYEVGQPLQANRLVNITTQRALKEQAMQCFASQLAMQAYDRHIAGLNSFRTYTLAASVMAAEAFCLLEAHEIDAFVAAVKPGALTQVLVQAEGSLQHAAQQQREQTARLERLQAEHDALIAQQHETAATLAALLHSRSWRITAPLRWLMGRLARR